MGANGVKRCEKKCDRRGLHCDLCPHETGSHYDRRRRQWWGSHLGEVSD